MKWLKGCNISMTFFKAVAIKSMILVLSAMLSCQLAIELNVQVILPPNHPPIFMVSQDEDFESPANVQRLRVFRRGNTPISERIYWVLNVGSTQRLDLSRTDDSVWVSSITYGVVPEGLEEATAVRPLEPGVEYCVEVYDADLIDPVVECFIYEP